jgi:hypothetical protein
MIDRIATAGSYADAALTETRTGDYAAAAVAYVAAARHYWIAGETNLALDARELADRCRDLDRLTARHQRLAGPADLGTAADHLIRRCEAVAASAHDLNSRIAALHMETVRNCTF